VVVVVWLCVVVFGAATTGAADVVVTGAGADVVVTGAGADVVVEGCAAAVVVVVWTFGLA
jgi:hypothetical protein